MRGWLARNRLVLFTGLAAALPVIVSTVHAAAAGWLPLGDDAIIAVRSYDVLSTHPPLLGPYSTSSQVIGHPVLSPGPLLFWLLALPVRLGELGPAIAIGMVNVCSVVGIVALARRRGGQALMFATGAAVAAMCASMDASVLHGVWGPSATLVPFTLMMFLAWSVACGEHRLLPLTALVASFTVQSHLTYILPGAVLLVVALGFLVAARPKIPRRWLGATLAVVIVCWSLPLAEEAVHRPGNVERIVQTATASKQTFGAAAGWHSVARAAGIPPWWLRGPRAPFTRIAEVVEAPSAVSTATALLVLVALTGVAAAAFRSRRRELAAAALLALGLLISLFAVTASTPSGGELFAVISYTIWWASPAGMFAWLVLGFGLVTLLIGSRPLEALRGGRRPVSIAGVVAVAAVGALVAAGGKHDRLENAFDPAGAIVDRVPAGIPRGTTVFITGDPNEIATDLEGAIAYALRDSGRHFVVSSLPGIGTRYDPAKQGHDMVLSVTEHPGPGRVIARALLVNVPSDGPPARRVFHVTLAPPSGGG
jgi:hypothetical protein